MPVKMKTILVLVALGLFSVPTGVQADSMNSTMLSNPCAGCHGTDGESLGGMPSIKGKSPDFLVKTLMEFRSGKRSATVMNRIAKGYSDGQIKLLAEYFGSRR